MNSNAGTRSETSTMTTETPSDCKESVSRNGVEGQCYNLFESNRRPRHLLRPSINDDVDLMLMFRHSFVLLVNLFWQYAYLPAPAVLATGLLPCMRFSGAIFAIPPGFVGHQAMADSEAG